MEPGTGPLIVHCAHHRAGTGWFEAVLAPIARSRGDRFLAVNDPLVSAPPANVGCLLVNHANHFDAAALGGRAYRGSHMIRDPRDMAVSGYFYHLWSDEPWLHEPVPALGGRTYHEHLNELSEPAGLLAEIHRVVDHELPPMLDWDYEQPEFLELRYEDVIADEQGWFARLFAHLGFDASEAARGLDLVERASFRQRTGRKVGDVTGGQHLRSGASGQWQTHFSDEHREAFKTLAGDALITLGYEDDRDW